MRASRRRTGPGNTASPRAEKEHWAAKASCTDADAAQTQRVDGGFVTSFIPELFGVPRLSEHLTGYAIAAGEAEETDSDRAGASRYLEVLIRVPYA